MHVANIIGCLYFSSHILNNGFNRFSTTIVNNLLLFHYQKLGYPC